MNDLFLGFAALIHSPRTASSRDEERLLFRERVPEVGTVAWTEADLPLVDEADAILGPPAAPPPGAGVATRPPARPGACRTVDELGVAASVSAEQVLERYGADGAGRGTEASADDEEPRTFGHVIVDEAQDLTAMQWRMIARRCPSGSMTLVGDFGQASRPGAARGGSDVLAELPDAPHRTRSCCR